MDDCHKRPIEPKRSGYATDHLERMKSTRRSETPELHLVTDASDHDLSDVRIVAGLIARDRWAQDAAWHRYSPAIYRFLYRSLGSVQDAEDRTQEVFFCLYSKIDELRRPEALRSFLFATAVRLIRWELRRRRVRRLVALSETGDPPEGYAPAPDHVARRALRRFYAVLDTLTEHERTIFVLRHMEGFTLEEVSDTMGLSLATVKRHLAKASERFSAGAAEEPDLRGWIEQKGGVP
jgi:RNA polymerase sigma-70 factor (ECF subfamily)